MTLCHDLSSSLDKGIKADMLVLDLSKAFDRVPTNDSSGKWNTLESEAPYIAGLHHFCLVEPRVWL